jgi:centrosomal protein CEP76
LSFYVVVSMSKDENGSNRPVCSFVRPLKTGRLLDTPRQAARFVSLIGYNKVTSSVGINENVDQWLNLHTFLVKNRGVSQTSSTSRLANLEAFFQIIPGQ